MNSKMKQLFFLQVNLFSGNIASDHCTWYQSCYQGVPSKDESPYWGLDTVKYCLRKLRLNRFKEGGKLSRLLGCPYVGV